ncbi:hypothetical protein RJ641_030034 [Dillenia turbinata]|uniref:AP2/ERF domain-containing protein n=1 Tax=Dillenia turbinata TaxID=194707 RepID=A0AAN8ZN86_9MAGN
MVSLRRRKLLGLCSGRSSFLAPLPKFPENGNASENPIRSTKPVSVHPMPAVDFDKPIGRPNMKASPQASHLSASTPEEQDTPHFAGQEVKRRKRHRRKHLENQEPCVMRGVYFKNMKWQAAIKVDKKQIHLGTVNSQEEAARLYDRAAFMCGREPNFELSREEKLELMQFNWDEFLAKTRQAITTKKHQRRAGAGSLRRPEFPVPKTELNGDGGVNDLSASEDAEPDTPTS